MTRGLCEASESKRNFRLVIGVDMILVTVNIVLAKPRSELFVSDIHQKRIGQMRNAAKLLYGKRKRVVRNDDNHATDHQRCILAGVKRDGKVRESVAHVWLILRSFESCKTLGSTLFRVCKPLR